MRIHVAGSLAPATARMMDRVVAAIGPAGDALEGTLVVGADDAMVPGADVLRPLAVVPARGPGRPTPWGAALVAAADAVILLDPTEAHAFPAALEDRAIIVAGLAAPRAREAGDGGLDDGGAPDDVRAAWRRHGPPAARGGPGVAWVWGRGVAPLTAALDAWAAGRAVVALPGTDDNELLRRGRALRARSVAEVVEATRFLLENPPVAEALGARGRTVAARLPSARQVALRLIEGMELARQSAGVDTR